MRIALLLGAGAIASAAFVACGSDSFNGSDNTAGGAGGAPSLPTAGDSATQAGSSSAGTPAQGGAGPGEAGSSSAGEAGAETGMAGAGSDVDACPSGRGSPMVRLPPEAGGFCIDAHETTRAEYAMFLAEPNVAPQPAACAFNAVDGGYTPGAVSNSQDMNLPQGGVDWCDARAYCEWAGKRLCGKIGGGAVPLGMSSDASVSQWQSACSRGGTRVFPYGNQYQGETCNGFEAGHAALISALDQTCEGGYEGIFNMSGNAWEWEDACGTATGPDDTCQLRSGEFSNDMGFLRCDYLGFAYKRNFNMSGTVGIRCCGP